LTPAQETQQLRLLENYIKALKENIHSRFDGELPIVSGFSIFNPLMLPAPGTGSFTEQGSKQVKTLADHFYQGHQEEKTKKEELLAEWEKFKFDMDSWKQEIQEGMNESHQETATEWCLKWLISLKTAYSTVFPALANITEICLSMPVSNAWPERGCSAIKHIKTRLRNRLGVDMLQVLLMIAINGPQVGTPECNALITVAIEKWQAQKRRRKMPERNEGESLSSASATSVSSQIQSDATEIADASVQTDTPVTDFQAVSSKSEVEIASAALNLTADVPCHDDTDSDYDSECDDLDDDIFF